MEPERINKYLSTRGLCSRRQADRLIEEGQVFINGIPAQKGQMVTGEEEISIGDTPVSRQKPPLIVYAYHKPRGLVCSEKGQGAPTIYEALKEKIPQRVFSIGRLDKESEGLVLLTNDGDLAREVSMARYAHEKEYEVTVSTPVSEKGIRQLAGGMYLPELNKKTRPCFCQKTGPNSFTIILTQGLNRQIRRMCSLLSWQVITLKRVRIMHISLEGLGPGEFRALSSGEYASFIPKKGKI